MVALLIVLNCDELADFSGCEKKEAKISDGMEIRSVQDRCVSTIALLLKEKAPTPGYPGGGFTVAVLRRVALSPDLYRCQQLAG